jgi:hypothetical protein
VFNEVYILFYFNVILKQNWVSSTKITLIIDVGSQSSSDGIATGLRAERRFADKGQRLFSSPKPP